MEKWVGKILIDVSPPERSKFKSPLILLHGVWTSSRCWRKWATHFSNLGWECWAVNSRGRFEKDSLAVLQQTTFQDWVDDLKQVIRAADFPPVLLGHDLGGTAAQAAAAEERTSAVVVAAALPSREMMPQWPRALRLMRLKYSPLLFLRRPFRVEEKDFRKHWLNAAPQDEQAEALRSLVPESPALIREFFERRAARDLNRVAAPVLVAAGGDDRISPPASLRRYAEILGAEFQDHAGHGHWIIGEDGGEEVTRDIHRWIVKRSGEGILLEDNTRLE